MVSSRLLIAAAIAAYGQLAMAQTVEPTDQGKSAPTDTQSQTEPETPTASTSTSLGSNSIFNESISQSELSLTPSYALSGRVGGQPGTMTAPVHGAPIVMDSLYLYPTADLTVGHNSNVIGTTTGAISSSFVSLTPDLVAEEKNHGDRYTLSYFGNYTQYTDDSPDNFYHHNFQLAGDDIFSSRARLGWLVGYDIDSDPRGSTDILTTSPDKWHASTAAAIYSYGAPGAIGRIEVESSVLDKRYDNNLDVTNAFNVDIYNVAARFLYRVAPKTSLLIEAREITSDYTLDSSPNNNTDRRLLVGATWVATAATTGIFKIGELKKDYTDSPYPNYSGLTWEGTVVWTPLTYSTITLTTSKAPSDSTGVGDYLVNRNEIVSWDHKWTQSVTSHVSLAQTSSQYVGVDRQDDTTTAGFGLKYQVQRWLRIGAEFDRTQRTSNAVGVPFDRNVALFTLEATL